MEQLSKCPKCQGELYRDNPLSLEIRRDCRFTTTAKQTLSPLAKKTFSNKRRIWFTIKIWYCPVDSRCYSYSISINGGVAYFGEYEDDPYLSGKFHDINQAMEAAIASTHE